MKKLWIRGRIEKTPRPDHKINAGVVWVAVCDDLRITAGGDSQKDAMEQLMEALRGFFHEIIRSDLYDQIVGKNESKFDFASDAPEDEGYTLREDGTFVVLMALDPRPVPTA